jgi:hypothetical protein
MISDYENLALPRRGQEGQTARAVRHRTCLKTGRRSRETVYVITDLTREDAAKVHTEHDPENMATLRGFAINCLRAAGHHNIAAGLREMSYEPFTRPLALLGLH